MSGAAYAQTDDRESSRRSKAWGLEHPKNLILYASNNGGCAEGGRMPHPYNPAKDAPGMGVAEQLPMWVGVS